LDPVRVLLPLPFPTEEASLKNPRIRPGQRKRTMPSRKGKREKGKGKREKGKGKREKGTGNREELI
jgi:hypothetical protein